MFYGYNSQNQLATHWIARYALTPSHVCIQVNAESTAKNRALDIPRGETLKWVHPQAINNTK